MDWMGIRGEEREVGHVRVWVEHMSQQSQTRSGGFWQVAEGRQAERLTGGYFDLFSLAELLGPEWNTPSCETFSDFSGAL